MKFETDNHYLTKKQQQEKTWKHYRKTDQQPCNDIGKISFLEADTFKTFLIHIPAKQPDDNKSTG